MKKKSLNAQKKILNFKYKYIHNIFKIFENKLDKTQSYAVAVSGGPDSLALSCLTKYFSYKYGTKFYYFIVDHKLRKESSKEAKKVVKLLKKIGVACKILVWNGKKPKSNIQSIARFNRFSLIIKECSKKKIHNILLAHHRDDRDENFFIRLTRGSGLRGLISFSEKVRNNNINFLRPLLNFNKKDLVNISKNIFNYYVEDPSNIDSKFKRIRLRFLIEELEKQGLDKNKLNLTLNNLADSNFALNYYCDKNVNENTFLNKKQNYFVLKKDFFVQPKEVVIRSTVKVIQKITSNYYPPRGKSIVRLLNRFKNEENLKKLTLGGCLFKKVNETIIISKEIS